MKVLVFEGHTIVVKYENGKRLFDKQDICDAVGYKKMASMDHHLKGTRRNIIAENGLTYLDINGLKYLEKKANRTPAFRRLVDWANGLKIEDIAAAPKDMAIHEQLKAKDKGITILSSNPEFVEKVTTKMAETVAANDDRLYGIQEAAVKFGMQPKDFSAFLISEGLAGRYLSNNNIFWHDWFKKQGYGTLPILDGDTENKRQSNVAKITAVGMEYLSVRLMKKRESGVLAFAKEPVVVDVNILEKEFDDLVLKTFFADKIPAKYDKLLDARPEYRLTEDRLIANIKSIVAQVKLKDK